jgi:MYXO-CTERM domain-containing protein
MDFIERWFGISPDGGDGSTEALFLLVIVVVLALVGRRWIANALWRRD